MATLIYSTRFTEDGPWLLDEASLIALDAVIAAEWEHLSSHEESLIERKTRDESNEPWRAANAEDAERRHADILQRVRSIVEQRRKIGVILSFPSGHRLAVKNFAEAAKHHHLAGEMATGFELSLVRGEVRLEIELSRKYNHLEVKAAPEELDEARELFGAVYNWTRTVAPPRWQRWWRNLEFAGGLLWIFFVGLVLIVFQAAFTGNSNHALKLQAHQLLEGGIEPKEQAKAAELALALASDYPIKATPPGMTPTAWLILACGVLLCLACSFAPPSTIGLGKGATSVRRWRAWIQLMVFTIPTAIFSTFLWPKIQAVLSAVLP